MELLADPGKHRVAAPWEAHFLARLNKLRAWARSLCGGDSDAGEDLVQEAFVQLSISEPSLDTSRNIDGYLFKVLQNLRRSAQSRARRSPHVPLTVVDYDIAITGLRALGEHRRERSQAELNAIAEHALSRVGETRSGSVLLLRFFHELVPEQIAALLIVPRGHVDEWVRLARKEARSALGGPGGGLPLLPAGFGSAPDRFLEALRGAITSRPFGGCYAEEWFGRRWNGICPAPLSRKETAHLATCQVCLSKAMAALGTDPPAGVNGEPGRRRILRWPGRDEKSIETWRRRANDVLGSQPHELRVTVNGEQILDCNVARELELHITLGSQPVDFVEIFSEQGVRLCMLNVDTGRADPVEARTHLRNNVALGLALVRKSGGTVLTVSCERLPAPGKAALVRVATQRKAEVPTWPTLLYAPQIAMVLAVAVLWFLWPSRMDANELMSRAEIWERKATRASGVVLHREFAVQQNERIGAKVRRFRLEVWSSFHSNRTLRQLFSEEGQLLRSTAGTTVLEPEDVLMQEPSVQRFRKATLQRTVTVKREGDTYHLSAENQRLRLQMPELRVVGASYLTSDSIIHMTEEHIREVDETAAPAEWLERPEPLQKRAERLRTPMEPKRDLEEAELRVRLAFAEDESAESLPVTISRNARAVLVQLSGGWSRQIEDTAKRLRFIPDVEIEPESQDRRLAIDAPSKASEEMIRDPMLQSELVLVFGSARAAEKWQRRALDLTGGVWMSAEALSRTARRYPEEVEARLAPNSAALLARLRRKQRHRFAERVALLGDIRNDLGVANCDGAAAGPSMNWQQAAAFRAAEASRLRELATRLFASSNLALTGAPAMLRDEFTCLAARLEELSRQNRDVLADQIQ